MKAKCKKKTCVFVFHLCNMTHTCKNTIMVASLDMLNLLQNMKLKDKTSLFSHFNSTVEANSDVLVPNNSRTL